MRIYHGSKNRIEQPLFGYGKAYNDYGMGFYCTESEELAKEWAVGLDQDGYANIYDLDVSGLSIINLNSDSYCVLHWLAVLLQNREFYTPAGLPSEAKTYLIQNFPVDYRATDIMVGYRADDSYFSFAQDFVNGTISYRQLNNALHLGNLGEQIVLKSRRAFSRISFVDAEPVKAAEWFAKRDSRDKAARLAYFNVERSNRQRGDLYITQILDEEMKSDDVRLRQIVSRESYDRSR